MRVEKTELMVFITPHVVYSDTDANRVTAEQKSQIHMQGTPNKPTTLPRPRRQRKMKLKKISWVIWIGQRAIYTTSPVSDIPPWV